MAWRLRDGTLRPRDIDDIDVEGKPAYIFLGRHDPEKTPPPDQWLTKTGNVQGKYKEYADLELAEYCPECNKLYMKERVESPAIVALKDEGDHCSLPLPLLSLRGLRCLLRPQAQRVQQALLIWHRWQIHGYRCHSLQHPECLARKGAKDSGLQR